MVIAGLAHAGTLDTVKQRGSLNCGANGQLPGFGLPDAQGNWTGLDVDLCRAIAAAMFNDANKVKFVALTAKDRFTALQTGDVDVLVRNTTWTLLRDTQLGLNATGINYYDGQGFIIRKSLKVNSALELNDATICVQQGTTTELNLADYFRANFHITTSGHFSTPALVDAVAEIGADRVMFSVDYPFEDFSDAAGWFDAADISEADRIKIGRTNAMKLFKL